MRLLQEVRCWSVGISSGTFTHSEKLIVIIFIFALLILRPRSAVPSYAERPPLPQQRKSDVTLGQPVEERN